MNEVEQMERVMLLQTGEVKELLKKRRHYEYKLQKRNKEKTDFLEYIQYESNLLSLLRLRRETTGYSHKQAEIEGSIKTRINKLFKIMEQRNQQDVSVWLSHIQFLKTNGWEEGVSRLYIRLLQVHNDKPGLWIEAAKWEFEREGSAENARKILLRGLRFLPKSWPLHREYVKLELLYVEQLRKRTELLGSGEGDKETAEDNVTNCSLVRLVVNNAVETIDDPKFIVSLISTLRIFEFAEDVTSEVFKVLEERYSSSPITWDTLAREELKTGITPCLEKYLEGLELEKSEELFKLAFSTLTEISDLYPHSPIRILKALLRLLRFGKEHKLLAVEHYKFWLELLDDGEGSEEQRELLRLGLSQHPQSVCLWTEDLRLTSSPSSSLRRGLAAVGPEDRLQLWRTALSLTDPETGWRLLSEEEGLLDRTSPALRLLHLEQAAARNMTEARQVYDGYKDQPPYNASLHHRMVELEEEEDPVDTARVRDILTVLCQQLGHQEPRAWIEAARLEVKAGKPLKAASILARGETEISQSLRETFAVMREEMGFTV